MAVACVIPTHNRPAFLVEALNSVAAQHFSPAEVVVVSDTDDPSDAEIARDFATRTGMRTVFVRNPDSGASSSRNIGARNSSCAWIAFLDDDDRWTPDYLSGARDAIDQGVGFVVTWLSTLDGKPVPKAQVADGLTAREIAGRNPGFTGSNMIVQRAAFESVGGFDPDLAVANDLDFVVRLLQSGWRYTTVRSPSVIYRLHGGPQLSSKTIGRVAGLWDYFEKHRDEMSLASRRSWRFRVYRTAASVSDQPLQRIWLSVLALANVSTDDVRGWRRARRFWGSG